MSKDGDVQGEIDPRFERVREAFAQSFARGEEVGAAVSVHVDGRPVVDLWGGFADQARTRPWQRDTLVNVYSTTKGMAALCLHRLVDEGRIDLDAPVARYWPEYAQAGKGDTLVRHLLSHRAGLPAVREMLPGEALYDWEAMVTALAAEAPWWQPGEAHGYHAVTFGWLVGELVRRVADRSCGTYFRESIAGPLGADFSIGLDDEHHDRVAEMSPFSTDAPETDEPSLLDVITKDPGGMTARAFANPPSLLAGPNVAEWRRAEIPGANGHAHARAIARIYGTVANGGTEPGVRLFSPAAVERCRDVHSHGPDGVLVVSTRFGLGFMLPQPEIEGASFGPNARSFGHPGAGGSLGFADPEARIGFGYVMNRMGPHILIDPRTRRLVDAVYESLA